MTSPLRRSRFALASLALTMLMPSLDTRIANAGLPTLATQLGASFQAVQWIVLAYLLAITTLIVSVGRLGDIVGRRRLLLGGIAVFTVASAACGLAPSIEWLIAARAAQGLGAAVMLALTVALAGETVPKERIGSAMGLLGTMSALGTTLGPPLGGVLITTLGWRMIFLVNVPLGAINLVMAIRYLPADPERTSSSASAFDLAGTVLLALTLGAYALAMTSGRGHFGAHNLELLAAAMLGAVMFVVIERRVPQPLIALEMFRERMLSASLAMSAIVSTVVMATLVVGPFYLSRGLGLNAQLTGLALSAGPLVAALVGVPAGRLVDRFGGQRMTSAGLSGMALGALLLVMLPRALGVGGYVPPIMVMTAGYALFQAANNTAIMAGASAERRGIVAGMLSLSRNLGLITGASAMGAVFALGVGGNGVAVASAHSIAVGMRLTFAVAALLVAIAIVLATRRHLTRAVRHFP